MTIQQLYRKDVEHPKALVLNFASDLITDMFVPVIEFLRSNGFRTQKVSSEGLILHFSYFSGDRIIDIDLNLDGKGATYYVVIEGLNLMVIHEDDLKDSYYTLIQPDYDFL